MRPAVAVSCLNAGLAMCKDYVARNACQSMLQIVISLMPDWTTSVDF